MLSVYVLVLHFDLISLQVYLIIIDKLLHIIYFSFYILHKDEAFGHEVVHGKWMS